jgi:hypothetical protein
MAKTSGAPFTATSHSSFVIRYSRSERGMVTVLFIALLAIMMVLIMVETSSVIRLRREVKLLEQQQIKRLNGQQTNVVSTATGTTP